MGYIGLIHHHLISIKSRPLRSDPKEASRLEEQRLREAEDFFVGAPVRNRVQLDQRINLTTIFHSGVLEVLT